MKHRTQTETSHLSPGSRQQTTPGLGRLSAIFFGKVALLGLLLNSCADPEPGILPSELVDRSLRGELQLRLQGVSELAAALDIRVYRPDGFEIATGKIPVPAGQDAVSSALVLPAGLGYTVSLSGVTTTGAQCIGTALFNVVADQGTDVRVPVTCDAPNQGSNNGSVNVQVDIDTGQPGACPEISFISALPRKMNVGGAIKLRSAASHAAAQFRWTAGSGRFSSAQEADTDFVCSQIGPTTVTLSVGLGPNCEDRYSLELDCLSIEGGDPSSGGEGESGTQGGGADGSSGDGNNNGAGDSSGDGGGATSKEVRRIQFRPRVGTEDFACGRTYSALGTSQAKGTVSDFRFFVHNVRLVTQDGGEQPFVLEDRGPWQSSGVALVDFEGGPDAGCYGGTTGSNTELTGLAPAGVYTGIRFSIGVPSALSHADPSTLQAPLDAGGMAWSWLAGFKFLKFELGSGLLHVGSTGCTGTPPDQMTCSRANRPEIELLDFDPHQQVIGADIAAAFASSDLSQSPSCHSTGESCPPLFQEVGLNFEDGKATKSQSVFSAE